MDALAYPSPSVITSQATPFKDEIFHNERSFAFPNLASER